jgi:nitrile hydratase accessory protein
MSDADPPAPARPRDDSGPPFQEPWEAQAFAMTLALHERGLFSWPEWSRALAAELAAAAQGEGADAYYRHWLAALERLAAAKGVCSAGELMRYRRAWEELAERTPHGQPLVLSERPPKE